MLDVFYTEDGAYHQASLFDGTEEIINIAIDELCTFEKEPAAWEWMIWAAKGTWKEPKTAWYGTEPSLEQAKMAALETAIALAEEISKKPLVTAKARESLLAA